MSNAINPTEALTVTPTATAKVAAQAAPAQSAASGSSTAAGATTVQSAPTNPAAAPADYLDVSTLANQAAGQAPPPTLTVEQATQAFQTYLNNLPSDLQLQPDQQAGLVVYKVVNPVTQKVIKQFPPEEVVQQATDLRNAQAQQHSGILLDKTT